ncbi:hypothetical protein R1flu_028807 [Riccia fluitans]|uniref:Uncharacterized protein n=1 Tax=Riccia fluitans TaxID=41844 RepID=A0ABD1XMR6_9MARC
MSVRLIPDGDRKIRKKRRAQRYVQRSARGGAEKGKAGEGLFQKQGMMAGESTRVELKYCGGEPMID